MKTEVVDEYCAELKRKGYSAGEAPHGTMGFARVFLGKIAFSKFMVQMVARREKVSKSALVVGAVNARMSYEDVTDAIEALRMVLDRRCRMTEEVIDEYGIELQKRGYSPDGRAPNGTLRIDRAYLEQLAVGELMIRLVVRRQELYWVPVKQRSYKDLTGAVEALGIVIDRRCS